MFVGFPGPKSLLAPFAAPRPSSDGTSAERRGTPIAGTGLFPYVLDELGAAWPTAGQRGLLGSDPSPRRGPHRTGPPPNVAVLRLPERGCFRTSWTNSERLGRRRGSVACLGLTSVGRATMADGGAVWLAWEVVEVLRGSAACFMLLRALILVAESPRPQPVVAPASRSAVRPGRHRGCFRVRSRASFDGGPVRRGPWRGEGGEERLWAGESHEHRPPLHARTHTRPERHTQSGPRTA